MKIRQSNMELLRIIVMLMITLHHFLIDKYRGGIVYGNEFLDGWQWAVMLNGFVYIGVNVFILISGYFGIKFKWKGVFNLLIFCAFYMALNLIIQRYNGGDYYSLDVIIKKSLKATTRTTAWFIPCYIALYFLAPLLNSAREQLNQKQYLYVILILSAYCLWFGYIRQQHVFNHNGYSVGQFIWLYVIGGYIKCFNVVHNVKRYRTICVTIWLMLSMFWGVLTIALYSGFPIPLWRPITYNNPFTLVASIAFFCLFTTFQFQNRVINYIAKSVLAAYLFRVYFPPFLELHATIDSMEGVNYFLCAIIWTIARFSTAVGVD